MTIRNFLPGAPPAGSWVDIAVVIRVMIALTVALFFGVGSWWRFTRNQAPAEPIGDGPTTRRETLETADAPP